MTIAQQLKKIRKDLKLSQKAFAEKAGVGVMTINSYETGKRTPQKKVLEKIENVFGVKFDQDPTAEEKTASKKTVSRKKEKIVKKAEEIVKDVEEKAAVAVIETLKAAETEAPVIEELTQQVAAGEKEILSEVVSTGKEKVEAAAEMVEEVAETVTEKKAVRKKQVKAAIKTGRQVAKAVEAAAKKSGRKKAEKKETAAPQVMIQSLLGGSITVEEVRAKVLEAAPEAENIYVKPEENKAYWVGKKGTGSVDLWD